MSVGLAVAAVVVGGVLGVNAALIVVIAGLIGIMAYTAGEAVVTAPQGAA